MVDAVAKWPESEEPEHAVHTFFTHRDNAVQLIVPAFQGFCLANNTSKQMFDFFEENPERMNRFKDAMSFLQTFPGLQNSYVLEAFDWAALGKGLIVDVSGSHGLVSQDIAGRFPSLTFIVQDLPNVIEDAKTKAAGRIGGLSELHGS